jgi:hypothetical protein
VIQRVYSQLADFPRLVPTPASSGEVGRSAVNRRVASSNLARGAKCLLLSSKYRVLVEHSALDRMLGHEK